MTASVHAAGPSAPASAVYRAVWRWHFYAGLIVLPFLAMLAVTGAVYLFKDEVDDILYRPYVTVTASHSSLPPSAWLGAAEQASGARVRQLILSDASDRAVRLTLVHPDGERLTGFVDPHTGHFLGSTGYNGVMETVKRLHSLELFGPIANILVEIVAGWAIVLVATGTFLWWPRGRGGGVITVRGSPAKRPFWRDLHAVSGAAVGVLVVFLAVTGMPWSAVWGAQVNRMTDAAGLGRPITPQAASAGVHAGHELMRGAVPWALENATMSGHGGVLGVDEAVARVAALTLPRPYTLTLPTPETGLYVAAYMPDAVKRTRTVYLDAADGQVLADVGYGRFGAAAQAIEWGISVHQGQQFGLANQIVMLVGCLGIIALVVTSLTMWWKRRPKGRLAAPPPPPAQRRGYWGLLAILLPLGVLYPLTGATMLLAALAEVVWLRRRRPA